MKLENFSLAFSLTNIGIGGLLITSMLLSSPAPSFALNYSYNVNTTTGTYKAKGTITTNTNTPNQNLTVPDIVDWFIQLFNNGEATAQLTRENSSLNYGYGLSINNTGNAIVLSSATNGYYSISFQNSDNSDSFYFGNPYNNGNGYASIKVNNTSPGSYAQPNLTFATAAVPWEFSPNMGIAMGLPLFIGLRRLKKRRSLMNSN